MNIVEQCSLLAYNIDTNYKVYLIGNGLKTIFSFLWIVSHP